MSARRSTIGVLATLCASLGTLAVTASAQANPPANPTITSMAIGGSDVTTDGAANDFYTNDPIDPGTGMTTDSFTVTVAGDPNASSIGLVYEGTGLPPQTPDANGDATFTIPSFSPTPHGSDDPMAVFQTVGGQTSGTGARVFVGNVPAVGFTDGDTLPSGGSLDVGSAIPGDTVELFVDGQRTDATADSNGDATVLVAGLTAGYHTAFAQTLDAQGHPSDPSSSVSFYVAPPHRPSSCRCQPSATRRSATRASPASPSVAWWRVRP